MTPRHVSLAWAALAMVSVSVLVSGCGVEAEKERARHAAAFLAIQSSRRTDCDLRGGVPKIDFWTSHVIGCTTYYTEAR